MPPFARLITTHVVEGQKTGNLFALDPEGGAPHHYCVDWEGENAGDARRTAHVSFQTAADPRALTNEMLLAILLDRLPRLQAILPCAANIVAIAHLQVALDALKRRTMDRIANGTEGTPSP